MVILSMHQDEIYLLGPSKPAPKGLKDSIRGEAVQLVSQGRSFLTRQVARIMEEDYIARLQQFRS
jgi:hypothetical protein